MIYSIGEALIDLFDYNNGDYIKKVGGTNANVAAAISLLGGKSSLIAKLGEDSYGHLIIDTLKEKGVDTSKIFLDKKHSTGIIKISSIEGNSEYCRARSNSADRYLNVDDINVEWFREDDILHFCSSGLVNFPCRNAHLKAIKSLFDVGGRISFDINLRPLQWSCNEKYTTAINDILKYVHYLKVSEEELNYLYGNIDIISKIKMFFERGKNLVFIILTMAEKGSTLFLSNGKSFYTPYYNSNAVDVTGAGDCFIASILYCVYNTKNDLLDTQIVDIMKFATAASSLQVKKTGAIDSLPTYDEVYNFINNNDL